MTALKGAEIDRLIAKPEAGPRVVLLYGPDPGAVSERAVALTERLVGKDTMAIVRLDADEIASETGRLADEVFGSSLFADRKVVRLRAGSRAIGPAVQAILDQPPENAWLIIEAGDLRKGIGLRRQCEDSRAAASIGCYPDTDAALGRLIDDEVKAAGLTIAPEARHMLVGLLGADRAASRSEIKKLCLYAHSAGAIGVEDIAAVIGDGAAYAIDAVVDAAFAGDAASMDRGLRRLVASGTSPGSVATAAERKAMELHRLRAVVDAGETVSAVVGGFRPPLMPSRRQTLELQLRRWSGQGLDWAVTRMGNAVRDSRTHPANISAVVSEALGAVARRAVLQDKAGAA